MISLVITHVMNDVLKKSMSKTVMIINNVSIKKQTNVDHYLTDIHHKANRCPLSP